MFLLKPRKVAHAHCDLMCGVYDPAQARIEAESVKAIAEKYQASDDDVFRQRCVILKEERAEVLWQALEKVIPDVRERSKFALVGTPLTHERFLRRHRGTYGAGYRADRGQIFPGPTTPLPGLLCCGDSTMPGIGVPAVAVSGLITAGAVGPVGVG